MSEDFLWMCPQCSTTYTPRAAEEYAGRCSVGHEPRDLVKHDMTRRLPWVCPSCKCRFGNGRYLKDPTCSRCHGVGLVPNSSQRKPRLPAVAKIASDSQRKPYSDAPNPAPEAIKCPEPPSVETEEGEYDFGFGRSAPKVEPAPEVTTGYMDDPFHPTGSDVELMQRTIRVLVDKLGGKVELNPMEVIYIMKAQDDPVPVIEREDTVWGGRIILRTEGGK